jgi:hypothetical protein
MGCKFNTAIVKWTSGCLDFGCRSVGPSVHSVMPRMHKKVGPEVFTSRPTVQGYGETYFRRRRPKRPMPTKPMPISDMVIGSGAGTG